MLPIRWRCGLFVSGFPEWMGAHIPADSPPPHSSRLQHYAPPPALCRAPTPPLLIGCWLRVAGRPFVHLTPSSISFRFNSPLYNPNPNPPRCAARQPIPTLD